MDAERWARLKELFERARDLRGDRRDALLDRLRRDDPELVRDVTPLLAVDEAAAHFFENLEAAISRRQARQHDPEDPDDATGTPDPLIGSMVGHYRIESRLGAGGMGMVYRAHDTKLERPVALKFLPPQVGAEPSAAKRFLLESRAAAALDHPNVCTVYEIGEAEGRGFIAMAYYPGETLREILRRGPLPPERCADYARQIASALAAAHRRGIIHRDIKPGNIIVTPEGVVKVLDFGLAKLADVSMTREHQRLGTLAYMAPEQLRGEPLDARVDLWALGVVWYEMLTGRRPFRGESPATVAHQILHDRPPPVLDQRPEVSEETSRLIESLLQRDPDSRPSSADSVASGLLQVPVRRGGRRLMRITAAAIVALAGLAYAGSVMTGGGSDGAADRTGPATLAVLPLDNLTGSVEEEYFVDGITETLIAELGRIGRFSVISRTSMMRFKRSELSLPQIAREVGADLLVEGSLMRDGDAVRITATLVHGADDRQMWTGRFDRKLGQILDLQSDVARTIADQVQAALGTEPLAAAPPVASVGETAPTPEAFDAYMKGRYHFNRWNAEGLREAVRFYQQAITLDPTFALAHAGLAEACAQPLVVEVFLELEDCRSAAVAALELDEGLSEAHAALAQVAVLEWDWDAAERAYLRALELNPNSVVARFGYSELLTVTLRRDQAVAQIRRAERLDPLNLMLKTWVAIQLSRAHRNDEAMEQWDSVLDMDPDFALATYNKGLIHAIRGQADLAYEVARATEPHFGPETSHILNLWAFAHAAAGNEAAAVAVLERLQAEVARGEREYNGYGAVAYLMLGREEDALDWLEEGLRRGSPHLAGTTSEPELDPLREHPRFRRLRSAMGLP